MQLLKKEENKIKVKNNNITLNCSTIFTERMISSFEMDVELVWASRCDFLDIILHTNIYWDEQNDKKSMHVTWFLTRFVTKQTIVSALVHPNCNSHRKIFPSTVGVSMVHYREAGVDLFLEGHRFTPTPNPGHDSSR